MLKIGKVLSAVAAISLTAAPVAAAEPRAASPVADSEHLGGGAWLLALLVVIGAVALIDSSKSNEYPNSP